MLIPHSPQSISIPLTRQRRLVVVRVAADFYIALGSNTISWPDRSTYAIVIDSYGRRVGRLHVLAWEHAHGCRVPAGFHVHHLGSKADNRHERLELLANKCHAIVHAVERGNRPTARPRRLLKHERSTAPARPFPRAVTSRTPDHKTRIERHLAKLLPSVIALFEPEECLANRIPPSRIAVRLAATAGEAALGLLTVLYAYDLARLAHEVALDPADVPWLQRLVKRTVVRVVIERWTKLRRLPRYALR